jgi:HPt (histidine-containing phosphotransfer) domain-containing protein
MNDYLSKPLRLSGLAEAIGRCPLEGSGQQREVVDPAVLNQLVASYGDDPELIAEVAGTFIESAPEMLQSIREAFASGDAAGVRMAAHTLKSNAATFGAIRLSELSRELEALARSGSLEGTADLLARIEGEYESVRIALETVRERGRP